jgi:hypothetical protein
MEALEHGLGHDLLGAVKRQRQAARTGVELGRAHDDLPRGLAPRAFTTGSIRLRVAAMPPP